ncbi:unnamed protein product [Mucor hiemalis]
MKSTLALTLFATLAVQQVVLAQEDGEVNIATAPPAAVETPNIYWWTSLLTGDEIKNYLTEPATAAATGIPTVDAATTADAATATTAAASDADASATTSAEIEAATASSATASSSEEVASIKSVATSLASAESSLASVVSEVSSSASSVAAYSTPSVVAWSSAASSSVFIAPTNSLPRPSGSIIPPVTTSGSIQPANGGSLLGADLGKILFSVTVGAFLGNFLN